MCIREILNDDLEEDIDKSSKGSVAIDVKKVMYN